MSQDSWCWACTGVGDGDARSVNDIINQNMLLGNINPDTDGVIYWTSATPLQGFSSASDGLLAPTNPAGNTVRIASGVGIVQGWLYANDADVDFDVSGGNANATDLIVLRRSDPASVSTVRLALVRGPAAGTATVTQTATTWEVAIAEVLLDGSGNFSALTDVRKLANPPIGQLAKIGSFVGDNTTGSATFSSIPSLFNHLVIRGKVKTSGVGTTSRDLTISFNGNTTVGDYLIIYTETRGDGTEVNGSLGGRTFARASSSHASVPAGAADEFIIHIHGYKDTTRYTNFIVQYQTYRDGTLAELERGHVSGWFEIVSVINAIQIDAGADNFVSGTIIDLYGVI